MKKLCITPEAKSDFKFALKLVSSAIAFFIFAMSMIICVVSWFIPDDGTFLWDYARFWTIPSVLIVLYFSGRWAKNSFYICEGEGD